MTNKKANLPYNKTGWLLYQLVIEFKSPNLIVTFFVSSIRCKI